MNRKEIVKKLNQLFCNRESLYKFCDILDNDIDKIILTINKLLKYIYANNDLEVTLESFAINIKNNKLNNIDVKYKLYLEKCSKGFFSFLKRQKDIKLHSDVPLDKDLKISDLEGLRLPSLDSFKEICNMNIHKKKIEEEKKKIRSDFYCKQKGFSETGLIYYRPELMTINKDMIYYHQELTGEIEEDFDYLYSGERYNGKTSSPLNNDFSQNLAEIIKMNDISLMILGNVVEIENGRHRIIYLLKTGIEVTIPIAKVARRIEDKEIKSILDQLKKVYGINVYKNNILDDNVNILLILNGYAYIINGKDELIKFNDCLKNGKHIESFNKITFNTDKNIERQNFDEYCYLIYKKYLEVGDKLFNCNFTDILGFFPGEDNFMLYFAYNDVKIDYQKAKIFGYDFKKYYEMIIISRKHTVVEDIAFRRE